MMKKNFVLLTALLLLAFFTACNAAQNDLTISEPPVSAPEDALPADSHSEDASALPPDEEPDAYMQRIAEASAEALIPMAETVDGAYADALLGRLCGFLLDEPLTVIHLIADSSLSEDARARLTFGLGYELIYAPGHDSAVQPLYDAKETLQEADAEILREILSAYEAALTQ